MELGDKVKDVITGFEGIVTARASYLTGCDQLCVQPQGLDKDQKPIESRWYDENRLVVTQASAVQLATVPFAPQLRAGGGPQDEAPRK